MSAQQFTDDRARLQRIAELVREARSVAGDLHATAQNIALNTTLYQALGITILAGAK